MDNHINLKLLDTTELNNSTFKINSNSISSSVSGQEVILNLESNIYYGLNSTGCWIWLELKKGNSLGIIKELAISKYSIDDTIFENNLIEFIQALLDNELISIVPN